jgi:hypothetical protein
MLFELANSLRSLTSPLTSALHAARRMARPLHFEEGGTVPTVGRVVDQNNDSDFLLPPDIDPMVVALVIDQKLRAGRKAAGLGDDPMRLLERRAGGRIVVAGHHLLRLGDGNFAKGREFPWTKPSSLKNRSASYGDTSKSGGVFGACPTGRAVSLTSKTI